MKFRKLLVLFLFISGIAVAAHHEEQAIGQVLDDFHDAAAHGALGVVLARQGKHDEAILHFRRLGRVPDWLHAHYADAGYVASQLAGCLGLPMVFTGHSLSINAAFDRPLTERR